jgi:hypothetical protein
VCCACHETAEDDTDTFKTRPARLGRAPPTPPASGETHGSRALAVERRPKVPIASPTILDHCEQCSILSGRQHRPDARPVDLDGLATPFRALDVAVVLPVSARSSGVRPPV